MASTLSKRGDNILKNINILDVGTDRCYANPYNKDTNPQGTINVGRAENHLTADIVAKKLSEIESPFLNNGDILKYDDMRGNAAFRNSLAAFLTKHGQASKPLDPNNLVILNGCGSVIAALAMVLGDPGDGWLIPTPVYPGIEVDIREIPEMKLVQAYLPAPQSTSENICQPFQLTIKILEDTLQKAKAQGVKVRTLILVNPNNPLGDVYSKELTLECLQFAKKHRLHVIMDEIYMLSIFQEDVKFTSAFSFDPLPDPQRTHVIWGFSKDFCMSGMSCGAVYTWNNKVLSALKGIAYFFSVPTPIQAYLNEMIKDNDWVENTYLPISHQRLRASHSNMSAGLTRIGVPHLLRPSGLYIWIDLSNFISPNFEDELLLFNELLDNNVYIAPGQIFHCIQPGWFRLIFSVSKDEQEVVLKRISEVLQRRRLQTMKITPSRI